MVRVYHFAVMVTGMQFFKIIFYESQVEYRRKVFTKETKKLMTFYIAALLHFYDLNYLNYKKPAV